MITLGIYEKVVTGGRKDIPPININSKQLLKSAIESNGQITGIINIRTAIKILDKIESADLEISLTEDEFEFLYNCIDKTSWVPSVLQFREFWEELEKAKGNGLIEG